MNISGFDKTKDLADKIQAQTEGEVVSNSTGTNNVNSPIDDGIEMYNKGVDFTTYGNHHVFNESIFNKKPKSGVYHEPMDEDAVEHPLMDIAGKTREVRDIATSDNVKDPEAEFDKETEDRRMKMERRSNIDNRRENRRK